MSEVFFLYQIHQHQDLPSLAKHQELLNARANQKESLANYTLSLDHLPQLLPQRNSQSHVSSRSRIWEVEEESNGDITPRYVKRKT